ncbi:hypothetical protein DV515_00008293 [Chloebia gouldiae]|uniref:Uncharacterized protein n=1 Tax=Chloebia gouldiae TaxID=44316 RepID=A0A3L8SEJ5_CHLGU|nr:hypothetical protein DV515_00008293 [Chloebia gouldiae]
MGGLLSERWFEAFACAMCGVITAKQQRSLHFEVLVFSITQPTQKPWVVCGHSIFLEEKHIKTAGKGKNRKNAALGTSVVM